MSNLVILLAGAFAVTLVLLLVVLVANEDLAEENRRLRSEVKVMRQRCADELAARRRRQGVVLAPSRQRRPIITRGAVES